MSKGRQVENFEFLGSASDTDFVGEPICDEIEFRFDVYAPANNAPEVVGTQSNGKGNFDLIQIFPGFHVQVFISEDGEEFEQVATWNATGPRKVDIKDDGGFELTFNGHQLISDPAGSGTPDVAFLKYGVGRYTYVGDANGDAVQDLSGSGQLWDLVDLFC